jgi:hypothetical protein
MAPITRSQARRLAQQNQQKKETNQQEEIKLTKKNIGRKRKNHKLSEEELQEITPPLPSPRVAPISSVTPSSSLLMTDDEHIVEVTKKIKLSEEELTLNGAPEGELFDVAVLPDDSLTSLNTPDLELSSALNILTSPSATWAERHQSIEIIRRGCRHHSELISQDQLLQIFQESCQEIESLRSCVSRNGIYCLKALYQLSYPWSGATAGAIYERSIHLLMNKSSSGPKFLCQLAIESLEFGVRAIPWNYLIAILQPFNSHKNAETSSRSYSLVANRLLLPSSSSSSSSALPSSLDLQTQYSQYLTSGLHSPRPQSREACKKALIFLFRSFGNDLSKEIVEQSISPERKAEVLRLVEESQKKLNSSNISGNKENTKERNRPPIRPVWKPSKASNTPLSISSSTASGLLII